MTESPQPQSEKLIDPTAETPEAKPSSRKALIRWGLVIAAVAHVVIFVVLFVVPNYTGKIDETANNDNGGGASQTGGSNGGTNDSPEKPKAPITEDPDWKEPVQNLIQDAVDNHKDLSEEQKLSELDEQARKLQRISTDENVQAITKHLAPLINQERATEPVEQPDPPADLHPNDRPSFDHDSGQIHDVVKSQKDGKTIYVVTMLDKNGLTMETEMSAAEGEYTYNLFQRINKNSMLKTIYRSNVMGTLDKLLQAIPQQPNEVPPAEGQQPEPAEEGRERSDEEATEGKAPDAPAS